MNSAAPEAVAHVRTFGPTDQAESKQMDPEQRNRMIHTLVFDLTHLALTLADRVQQLEDEVHFATRAPQPAAGVSLA